MAEFISKSEILEAVKDARLTMRAADGAANDMAILLIGRLHHVGPYALKDLKRELAQYNMHTERWT